MTQKPEPKPDTYEAGMAQNQLLKIGTHAIKIHNMIDDDAEMEAWVAKKIDLASNYVKSVHGYTAGSKAGTYDDGGLTEDAPFGSGMDLLRMAIMKKFISVQEWDLLKHKWKAAAEEVEEKYSDWPEGEGFGSSDHNFAIKDLMTAVGYEFDDKDTSGRFVVTKQPEEIEKAGIKNARMKGVKDPEQDHREISRIMKYEDAGEKIANMAQNMSKDEFMSHADELGLTPEEAAEHYEKMSGGAHAGKFEDAGEGHMSKSQLYQTAKMAIELLDMIKKGDDLEGWVQTKLNLAADYLQAVYHYEDYQKLNPYREELDANIMQRHAGIIQKHLDEILERKCRTEDIDTKPGMMRILKKRVNEVEKEIAKENRKTSNEGDMEQDKQNPIAKPYINKPEWKALHDMDDKIIHAYLKHKKHKTNEAALEEGKLKDWAKSLAMAGIFVAGLAGVGSINDAINNSVPAIQAMNTALEMAKEKGDDNLVAQIEKDLKGAKLRLDIGKDLNQVKYLQDKYEKFIAKESIAYESKLAMMLNQQLK